LLLLALTLLQPPLPHPSLLLLLLLQPPFPHPPLLLLAMVLEPLGLVPLLDSDPTWPFPFPGATGDAPLLVPFPPFPFGATPFPLPMDMPGLVLDGIDPCGLGLVAGGQSVRDRCDDWPRRPG
jgi:hypothetical protein